MSVPYGTWPSPIPAEALVAGVVGVGEVVLDGDDLWWAETLPAERGRTRLVRLRPGESDAVEVTAPDADVRTRVHTYGGGAWWVASGVVVYSDAADGQLRRREPTTGALTVLTATPEDRYADGRTVGGGAGTFSVWVRERHGDDVTGGGEAVNDLVAVAHDGSGEVTRLVGGADFFAAPRPSPSGGRLAWLRWDHPNMPWDGTELWVGDLDTTRPGGPTVTGARRVAGGPDEWIAEPVWCDDATLGWVTDAGGWSRVRRADVTVADPEAATTWVDLHGAEIALAPWVFGRRRWGVLGDGTVVFASSRPAGDVVTVGDVSSEADSSVSTLAVGAQRVVMAAASYDRPTEIVEVTAAGDRTVLARPNGGGVADGLGPGFVVPPEPVAVATDRGETTHALVYRPANPDVAAPTTGAPPALVLAHGGPTGAARREFVAMIRYWTSRGWAVVDVDYRGSTGYGRAYRNALRGRWGDADVVDVAAAARRLAERGEIDPDRIVIRGSSAGGLTVLAALIAAPDVFAAGSVRYPVTDMESLVADTHKFEARLLDRLVGPYPRDRALYRQRSPLHHLDRLTRPMLVQQGADDEIVPPSQAEVLVEALEARGVPHRYLLYDGEGHGFRRAETIVAALEAESAFFSSVLGLGSP